jgi:hypothetical protein
MFDAKQQAKSGLNPQTVSESQGASSRKLALIHTWFQKQLS